MGMLLVGQLALVSFGIDVMASSKDVSFTGLGLQLFPERVGLSCLAGLVLLQLRASARSGEHAGGAQRVSHLSDALEQVVGIRVLAVCTGGSAVVVVGEPGL